MQSERDTREMHWCFCLKYIYLYLVDLVELLLGAVLVCYHLYHHVLLHSSSFYKCCISRIM
jgi:hypothetical protein